MSLMRMNAWLSHILSKGSPKVSLSIVILNDGIYLSKLDAQTSSVDEVIYHESDGAQWSTALDSALKLHGLKNLNAVITLGSHLYQSFQVEKPSVPEEEWPVALPFLLKDLISERVMDIVADGVLLEHNNKVQAYVLKKPFIDQLKAVLNSHQIQLLSISPENEVWSDVCHDASYMLLHRSSRGEFKISAFNHNNAIFHRVIRGIDTFVTGEHANSFHLDSLALELQRSLDYLAGQLKTAQINQLYLCCDQEQMAELQQQLQTRLNVKVEALLFDEAPQKNGKVLAYQAMQKDHLGVNLYPSHLQPKKDPFNLDNVALVWVGLLGVMLALSGFYYYQNSQLTNKLAQQQKQSQALLSQVKNLSQQVAMLQPSPAKVAAVARLKEDVKNKQDSLKVINSLDAKLQSGYYGVMQGLSEIYHPGISITQIDIYNDKMDIHGLTQSSDLIPNWLSKFKTQVNLVGRNFELFKLERNEDDVLTFSLASQFKEKDK